jgi:hypothetical protein
MHKLFSVGINIKFWMIMNGNSSSDDNHNSYWSPYDCLIGASLTESGLFSAATEVEIYTTIVPTVRPLCIESRSSTESKDMMVPLTVSGEVDGTKDPTIPVQIILS